MAAPEISFTDGAAYEEMMGKWSRLAGDVFLDWLAPAPALRWADIGCGNGAFTELLIERCAPSEVEGIDPSDGQIAYARTRLHGRPVKLHLGSAAQLPFASGGFDAAVMALVIFFVPQPAKGVAEMVRVVRPGGLIAAYAWDMFGGGFPLEPIRAEMRAMGMTPASPPSVEASRMATLRQLWSDAGLVDIETREITVRRQFADFEHYWSVSLKAPQLGEAIGAMPAADAARLKANVGAKMPAPDSAGLLLTARANAVKGRVKG